MKSFRTLALCVGLVASLFGVITCAEAQSLLSGDISGTVTDQSSGVVAGASVDLKGLDTGSAQSGKTDGVGVYRFSLLKPGLYSVTVTQAGFEKAEKKVTVLVGQVATADVQLTVGQGSQTIDVTSEGSVLTPTPSGNTTSFTPLEMELLPSAGGDITNIAETALGVVMNTTGGSANGGGNFSMNGLPATSNLFTVNGENDMDPYFNINNSGATNLTIGTNEIQEATVISSPYGGQYGQLSGAQVIEVTKSGGNTFHGNAIYWWNGRALNSNSFFNNAFGAPKPFSNANEWAASIGGPIKKNKTFFFVDEEGLRFVLPNSDNMIIPTQAFATAVLNNVTALHPGEAAAYKTMLGLMTGAPGASAAVPIPNSSYCTPSTLSLPGFNPATQSCAAQYEATPGALATEWVLAFKIDHKLSDRDNLFYRYRKDVGVQPSIIDPTNANFDVLSHQPQWDNQLGETHVFSGNATNQFITSFSHYVAQFTQNPQLVASTFPYGILTSGAVPFGGPLFGGADTGFNTQFDFPQGRNITQYQFIDDYTLVKGRNTFKFGENFRRYDVSDHNFTFSNPAVYFGYNAAGLQNFVNGVAYQYRKSLYVSNDVPIALWGVGMYAHDEIKVMSNLTVTLGFRVEHNSNPVCQANCFSNLKGPFNTLASVTNSNPGSIPYSADLNYGQHQAYSGVDAANLLPSAAFSWSPAKDGKTVVSGGFGIFYDNAPAALVDDLLTNPPTAVALRVRPAAGVLPFDPGPQGGAAIWQASASAFKINETYNQISTNLAALGTVFAPPAVEGIIGTVHSPRVYQWNFQVQRQLSQSTAFTVNYIGNSSGKIPYANQWGNAFDEFGIYPGVKGVPGSAADPNYGVVQQVQSGGTANYEGLQVSLRKQFSHSIAGHFNYTWSHALDDVSNGGVTGFIQDSVLSQLTPGGLATNYGNADYDVRHVITADFVYTPKFKTGNKFANDVVGGWQLGTKILYHTGLPFSVVDDNTALGNFSDSLLATPTGKQVVVSGGCGIAAVNTSCLNTNAFVDANAATFNAYTGISPQTRNQFRGPGYFGLDMNLYRVFPITERIKFNVGMTAFNLFNHPNFANPDHGYGDTTYGMITSTVSSPSTPYGNGLGFDGSVRVIQMTGKLTF